MQLDYITINGLDQETKERIRKDIESSGYKGSKSNYVVSLMNDGLDKREALREISSKDEIQTVKKMLDEQKETLKEILNNQCRKEIDESIYQKLLMRIFWMVSQLSEEKGIYIEDIAKGSFDELPADLLFKKERMNQAYDGR